MKLIKKSAIITIGDIMVALIVSLSFITILCAIILAFTITYNRIQDCIIRINEAEVNIDTILRKRFDLLNKSITIIKNTTKTEDEILDIIVKLRTRKLTNFELDRSLYDAINEFTSYKEKYKELKNCEEYLKIEINLFESESEIIALRKYYNDIITDYNKLIKSFPSNLIALVKNYQVKSYFDGNNLEDEKKMFKL